MRKISNHRICRGFTLIEILVVVAIIALLAAILFPAFSRARENARRSSCQSNLKQIALAFEQYKSDYDNRFPHAWDIEPADFGVKPQNGSAPAFVTSPADAPIVWPAKLEPYTKSRQIFNCPSRNRNVASSCDKTTYGYAGNMTWKDGDPVVGGTPNTGGPFHYGASVIGYGYNAIYLGGGQFENVGSTFAKTAYPSAGDCYNCGVGALESSIAKPSETILLMDNNFANRGSGAAPAFVAVIGTSMGDGTGEMWCSAYDSVEARHLDGLNVAFVDGHVKWMKKAVAAYRPEAGTMTTRITSYSNDPKWLWDRF